MALQTGFPQAWVANKLYLFGFLESQVLKLALVKLHQALLHAPKMRLDPRLIFSSFYSISSVRMIKQSKFIQRQYINQPSTGRARYEAILGRFIPVMPFSSAFDFAPLCEHQLSAGNLNLAYGEMRKLDCIPGGRLQKRRSPKMFSSIR